MREGKREATITKGEKGASIKGDEKKKREEEYY